MNKRVVTAAFVLSAVFASLSPDCVYAQSSLSAAQQKELVDYHNKVRREVGVEPVTWSEEVAAGAQKWADYLAATGMFKHSDTKFGENIAINSTVLKGAEAWYSEIKDYRPGVKMGQPGAQYQIVGHYTQMVWSNTKQIGAGVAVMQQGNFKDQLVIVCNYDPPGNYTGEVPYGPGAKPAMRPSPQTPTTPGDSAPSGFPKGYFHMTTKSAERQNLVLESAPVSLRKLGDYTGMRWKVIPLENGHFYMTSLYLAEHNQVLEGGDGNGAAVMVPNKGYSGTMWKAVPAGGGYYHLTSAFMEPQNKVLNGNVGEASGAGAPFQGAPHMLDKKSAGPGALWKFIPLPSE